MKIGVPQGLLYAKYHVFAKTFLEELGAQVIVSPNTNKKILDQGTQCCVDDACLPMKVYHGHVAWLKDRCDAILVPRFMGVKEKEHVCPMFCGLVEMISHDIRHLPPLIDTPVYSTGRDKLAQWAGRTGRTVTTDEKKIRRALEKALQNHAEAEKGICDRGYPLKIGLLGHSYNLYDRFINMDIRRKLNGLGIGVITSECIDRVYIDAEVGKLFKKPFWSFALEYYGAAVSIFRMGKADGIIYLSSFSCGIDSVVSELIRCEIGDFPFLVLKLDEHTGQAGFDTRIEAFSDMLKRRCGVGHNLS